MTACAALGLLIESCFMPGVHTLVVILPLSLYFCVCVNYVCFCSIVFTVYTIVAEKRVVIAIKGLSRPDSPQLLCCPVYAVSRLPPTPHTVFASLIGSTSSHGRHQ